MDPNATGIDAPAIHETHMNTAVEGMPLWLDEDRLSEALARLERHVKQVLSRRGPDARDVERASWILPAVWKQLTPDRWETLMLAMRVHDGSPSLFKLARSVRASKLVIDEGRAGRELISAVSEARAARRPSRAVALLIVASRIGLASRMSGDDLLWALKQVPEAIECATAWAWSHPEDSSLVEVADGYARAAQRRSGFAWLALWQAPTAERWERYASSYVDWHYRPDQRSDPGFALEHAKSWRETVDREMVEGPARAVVEERPGGKEALEQAAQRAKDRFVRGLLEMWGSRARDNSWQEKPYAEDGL